MYWKMHAFTAKREEIVQSLEGKREEICNYAEQYDMEMISLQPDYPQTLWALFNNNKLSLGELEEFFRDFAEVQEAGLSMHDSLINLIETSPKNSLKESLIKIIDGISEGKSLEEAFLTVKIFPKIACITIGVAEKTGNIPEMMKLLSEYFNYRHETRKKILKSLVYPIFVMLLLTGVSIFIALKLVPQLKSFLPPTLSNNIYASILLAYSNLIRTYWIGIIGLLILIGFVIKNLWNSRRERLMQYILGIPLIGELFKSMELSQTFMNLHVYQKSGINIISAIKFIHEGSRSYVSEKLMAVSERIYKGGSLGEAFKADPFFPAVVYQNLYKADASGKIADCFKRLHTHYDRKNKELIATILALIEPSLLAFAGLFMWMVFAAFVLPIYMNMNRMMSGHLN